MNYGIQASKDSIQASPRGVQDSQDGRMLSNNFGNTTVKTAEITPQVKPSQIKDYESKPFSAERVIKKDTEIDEKWISLCRQFPNRSQLNSNGVSILHLVLLQNFSIKRVQELLNDKTVNINAKDSGGRLPLDVAIHHKKSAIINLLLSYDADFSENSTLLFIKWAMQEKECDTII